MIKSLRGYLGFAACVVICAGVIFTLLVSFQYTSLFNRNAEKNYQSQIPQVADTLIKEIWLKKFKNLAQATASSKEIAKAFSAPAKEATFALDQEFNQGAVTNGEIPLLRTALYNKDFSSQVAISSAGNKAVSELPQEVTEQMRTLEGREKFAVQSFFWAAPDGQPVATIISPVGGMRLRGYVALHADPAPALENMADIFSADVHTRTLDGATSLSVFDFYKNPEALNLATFKAPYPEKNPIMTISTRVDQTKFSQQLRNTLLMNLAFYLLLMIALGVGLMYMLRRNIFSALSRVHKRVQAVARGEINRQPIQIPLSDEIGQLGVGINQMSDNLYDITSNIRLSADELGNIMNNYKKAAEEMNVASSMVADNTTTCSTLAHENNTSIHAESKNLQNLSSEFENINHAAQKANEHITKLNNHGDNILKVVSLIEDISDQTNLLALNAAIEAARAGEAGRGFAVVADEVKKLAEQTNSAIGDVSKTVTDLRTLNGETSQAMEEVFSAVKEGQGGLQKTTDSLANVAGQSESMTENISSIASAAEEQSATVESTMEQMKIMVGVAENLRNNLEQFKVVDQDNNDNE